MGEFSLVGDHSAVPLTRISCNRFFSKSQNAHKGPSVGIQTLILPAPFFRIFLHCADTHESLKHHNPLALFIITWVFSPGNVHCAGASQNTVIQNQYSYLENKLFLDTKIHILTIDSNQKVEFFEFWKPTIYICRPMVIIVFIQKRSYTWSHLTATTTMS